MTPHNGGDGKSSLLAMASICLSLSIVLWAVQLKRRTDCAEAKALLDPLTGVFNRRGWDALIARETARAQRGHHSMTIFIFDVDEFKAVNDRFGHAYGDDALRAVGAAITSAARAHDVVARLGGDEFALLALDDGGDAADIILARLETALAPVGLGISIGHASTFAGCDVAAATELADRRMYANKAARKARTPNEVA